jgi:hypothetical protein
VAFAPFWVDTKRGGNPSFCAHPVSLSSGFPSAHEDTFTSCGFFHLLRFRRLWDVQQRTALLSSELPLASTFYAPAIRSMPTPLYQPLLVCTSVSCANNVINSPETTTTKSPNLAGPSLTDSRTILRIGRKTSQRPVEQRTKWRPPILTASDRRTVSGRRSQSREAYTEILQVVEEV